MSDRRTWLALLIALLISVGAYWIWFFHWDIYTWGDWGFFYTETTRELLGLPQVWSSSGIGGIDIGLTMYPLIRFALGLVSFLLPAYQGLHLLYLLPSVFICSLGGFLLARYIHKSNLAGIVGSIIYTFNTYFLIIRGGHLPLMNAFALAPLILVTFLHGLKTSRTIFFALSGLLASIAAAYEIRGAYLIFALMAGLLVIHLPVLPRKTIIKSLISGIVLGFLSLYWVFGLFLAGGASDLSLFHRRLYGEGYAHLVRSSVLQLHQWSPSGLIGPGIQPTPLYSWIIPLLVFLELYLSRKNRIMVFFGLVSLTGIFFSKMSGQPFPHVYEWMFNYFPGFSIFREPSKFFFLTALGYSVLLSGFAHRAWITLTNSSAQKMIRLGLVALVSGLFLINARGVITGQLGDLIKPRAIPKDYLTLKEHIQNQSGFFRSFYFPTLSRWGYFDASHPTVSGLDLVQSQWYKISGYGETGLGFSYINEASNIFSKSFSDKLFDMSSIKYLIIPIQDLENNDDIFAIYGTREDYLSIANNISFLKPVDMGTSELKIYENSDYRPRLYLTDQLDTIYDASISATPVPFIRKSPSEYQVTLDPFSQDVYLNFSEQYHPGWRLSPEPVSWINIILRRQPFLPSTEHLQNTAGLNSFLLKSSPDTLSSQTFTLYFVPQAYLNLGLVLGLIGSTAILVLIVISLIRNKHV